MFFILLFHLSLFLNTFFKMSQIPLIVDCNRQSTVRNSVVFLHYNYLGFLIV